MNDVLLDRARRAASLCDGDMSRLLTELADALEKVTAERDRLAGERAILGGEAEEALRLFGACRPYVAYWTRNGGPVDRSSAGRLLRRVDRFTDTRAVAPEAEGPGAGLRREWRELRERMSGPWSGRED